MLHNLAHNFCMAQSDTLNEKLSPVNDFISLLFIVFDLGSHPEARNLQVVSF